MLFMSFKYAPVAGSDVGKLSAECAEAAFLANAVRGGENVATGALLGALVGASCGFSRLPRELVRNLAPGQRRQLDAEVGAFVAVSPLVIGASAAETEAEAQVGAAEGKM